MDVEYETPASVQFVCPDCGAAIEEFVEDLPSFDLMADSNADGQGVIIDHVICSQCSVTHEVQIVAIAPDVYEATSGETEVWLKVPHVVEPLFDDSYELYLATLASEDAWAIFVEAFNEIEKLKLPNSQLARRLIFTQYIVIMEAYLNHRLLSLMEEKQYVKLLVTKIPELTNKKVNLAEVLEPSEATDIVREHLQSLMYHNVPKLDYYFEACLNVTLFQDEAHKTQIIQLVHKRHDFVHRNGRDKGKMPVSVSPFDIYSVKFAVLKVVARVEAAFCIAKGLSRPEFIGFEIDKIETLADLKLGDFAAIARDILRTWQQRQDELDSIPW